MGQIRKKLIDYQGALFYEVGDYVEAYEFYSKLG